MVKTSNGYMLTRKGIKTKQDIENEKMLPELEKKTAEKQRSNVVVKLIDTGSVTGADTGKLKYIPKAKQDTRQKAGYGTTNEVGDKVKIFGVPPIKSK